MTYTYTFKDGREISASTVCDLLSQGVPRKLSKEGLWSYMLSGAVQEPFTLIDGVTSVKEHVPTFIQNALVADIQPKVTAAIEKAVLKSMEISCGPEHCRILPSAFLSGGIDSTALVAVMRRLYPDDEIRTYCVIHEDPLTDERQWARLASVRNHTKHTEFMLTADMFKRNIIAALDSYDQPSVDGINNYFASKFVADVGEHVIISGEGGDELFAGYGEYAKPRKAYDVERKLCRLKHVFGKKFNSLGWVGRLMTQYARAEKWKKLGQLLSADYDPYFVTRRQFDPAWAQRLLNSDPKISALGTSIADLFFTIQRHCGTSGVDFGDDLINRCSWMELRHNLRSMYMRDGIQTSTPFGLDIRTPLMDDELVSLMMSIPGCFKCDDVLSKILLLNSAREGIPEECIFRRKQGFALPFDLYIQQGLGEVFKAFTEGELGMNFNGKAIRELWQAYKSGKTSWLRVWQMFVLCYWCEKNTVEW